MTEHHEFIWQCDWLTIRIGVTFTPLRFGRYDHLEIQSLEPHKAPLPITETGYLSHFEPDGEIAALGGPIEAARMLLDIGANATGWKKQQDKQRQGSLF